MPLLQRAKSPVFWWAVLGPLVGYGLGRMTSEVMPIRHVQPPVVVTVVDSEQTPEGTSPGVSAPGSSSSITPSAPASPVDRDLERQSLEQGRMSLRQRRFAEALAALRQHERLYPRSQYKPTRDLHIAAALKGVEQTGMVHQETPLPAEHRGEVMDADQGSVQEQGASKSVHVQSQDEHR